MTEFVVESTTRLGLNPTSNTAVATVEFENNGWTLVRVYNGNASPSVWTVSQTAKLDNVSTAGKAVSVPASGVRYLGPYPRDIYGENVTIAVSVTTSVVFELIKIPTF